MNEQHYEKLKEGASAWNRWREENPDVVPDLIDAYLRGADLRGANLSYASLSDANLRGADLRGANLRDAYLRGADLSYAYLRGANLSYAYLRDADLRNAYLRGADLSYASLSEANLRGADLRDADLSYASLSDANLRDAVGNQEEVRSVHCFERTVTYTATHIFIGCQVHTVEEWFSITDDELDEMSSEAKERWRKWEPILKALITAYPATPTKQENEK